MPPGHGRCRRRPPLPSPEEVERIQAKFGGPRRYRRRTAEEAREGIRIYAREHLRQGERPDQRAYMAACKLDARLVWPSKLKGVTGKTFTELCADEGLMTRRIARRKRLPRQAPWAPPVEQTLPQVLADVYRDAGFTREVVANPAPLAKQPSRWDPPEQLPGTGMFSAYEELDGQVTVVRLLRSTPWLYRPLRDAVAALGDKPGKSGPKRMAGCWACAYFGMVESGEADVKPWFAQTTPEFWRACGMARMPAYKTAQKRIKEMEQIAHVFEEALERLVRHVRKREPRIGHAIGVDATMSESNARLHRLANPSGQVPRRLGKLPVIAARRMPTELVDDIRRAANAESPDAGPLQVSEYIDITTELERGTLGQHRIIRLKSGVYLSLDPDAGVRAYMRGTKLLKWWHGYLLVQAVDHFSGLPLAAHGFAADQNEHQHFPMVVEKAAATLGHTPFFVTTDKAYSIWACFEWSVERGITLVAPYRPVNTRAPEKAQPTVDFDEHGIPFCRHCRGGTDQVGFHVYPAEGRNGKPRPVLRVRCAAPDSDECLGVQEWNCRRDPTRLLPVWRTHAAYSEARTLHMSYERAHNEARSRANAKPRHSETRTKRVSLTLAIMRMNVYAIIAWLKAGVINGWLGTPALNPELERDAERQHRLNRKSKHEFINRMTVLRRLRLGYVGGGRIPHRTRGAPTRRATPTKL